MKSVSIIVLAITLGATAAPALAAPSSDGDQQKVTYNAKTNKYCFSGTVTGSRLISRDCRTKEDWAKDGVTIADAAAATSTAGK
jgi:hypothetical protein